MADFIGALRKKKLAWGMLLFTGIVWLLGPFHWMTDGWSGTFINVTRILGVIYIIVAIKVRRVFLN